MTPAEAFEWFSSLDADDQDRARQTYKRLFAPPLNAADFEKSLAYNAACNPRLFGLPEWETDRQKRQEAKELCRETISRLKIGDRSYGNANG
jgi:hypothetical protein